MRSVKHHKNPLLRIFCPNIYAMWREHDLVVVPNDMHRRYHVSLEKDRDFQYLLAVAEEKVHNCSCLELQLADELDELWKQFEERHSTLKLWCLH